MSDDMRIMGGGGGPRLSLDDLIKANQMQLLFAQASIQALEQAKADQEELLLLRAREVRRLERMVCDE